MNIQLHKVITDITGVTGMKIIRAIVAGERDAVKLAGMKHALIKSSAFYRRMRARLGAPKAITATAHKLAKLVYRMLRYGMGYVDSGQEYYENQYRQRVIKHLTKRAREMGYAVVCTNTGELVS